MSRQIADLFYPAVFGVFMASALALVLKHLFPHRPSMVGRAAVALVGSGFDYLENLFVWRALVAFPNPAASNSLLGLASAAKTITFRIPEVMLVAGVSALALQAIHLAGKRKRSTSPS